VLSTSLKLVAVQSNPKRDPRGQIIDTVRSTRLPSKLTCVAADDLQAVAWHSLSHALTLDLAFDHHDSLQRFATIRLA
jgi:ADP-ribose pyrophosphatase YjhB (NUDIX family)